ncbi:MAG: redoxin family protein [Pirellula sp.]
MNSRSFKRFDIGSLLNRLGILGLVGSLVLVVPTPTLGIEPSQPVDETAGLIGKKVEAITKLDKTDYLGKQWLWSELAGAQATVVVFLGTECPLAKQYTPRIVELAKKYTAKGVRFVAVDPNIQDSLQEMAAHARRFELEIPFLKDPDQSLADLLGVTRTPEVCVVDSRNTIRYRGRIDDQYGIGFAREKPTQRELVDALDAILVQGDVPTSLTQAAGCLIGRNRSKIDSPTETAAITYSEHVSHLLQQRCVSCHRQGDIGPMDLSSYDDASAWADMILEVTQNKTMPPWHATDEHAKFSNDRRLSDKELDVLERWVAQGKPRGNPDLDAKPIVYNARWLLPQDPDIIIPMSDKPYRVPRTGVVNYQYFRADVGNDKDLWVKGLEIVPEAREVVHHVLVFVREKGSRSRDIGGARSFLVGYVPGTRAEMMPKGYAKRIPANSELIFQVHYTPNGTSQKDLSKVGFILADPKEITHEVKTTSAVSVNFQIPPWAPAHRVTASLPEKLPDCELLSFSPHMHVRGKSFRYTLIYPDRKREILLDIPNYDFNWQTEYRLQTPMQLPAGSRIACEATFDNSEANLNNPDPKAWVKWGDQTFEEMMIGYFHYAEKRRQ